MHTLSMLLVVSNPCCDCGGKSIVKPISGTVRAMLHNQIGRYTNECTFRLNEGNCERHTLDRLESFVGKAFRHRITYRKPSST